MIKKMQQLIGERILKTALSVFLTAWICQLFNWPSIFAVIAAIVTIEPSVKSSIKKGIIRLPAAVIGAALAMLFDYLLGQVPLTYALSAFLTIYICYRLKWDDAIVVATLTALAMVEMTEDHYLSAFLTRIGTTSTGIIVSTLVNFLVWPPNYLAAIRQSNERIVRDMQTLFNECLHYQLNQTGRRQRLQLRFGHLSKEIDRTTNMISYQREEYQYRRHQINDIKQLNKLQQQMDILQNILSHIGDILNIHAQTTHIQTEDKQILLTSWRRIAGLFPLHDNAAEEGGPTEDNLDELYHILHKKAVSKGTNSYLSKAAFLAFELLTIHALLRELKQLAEKEHRSTAAKVQADHSHIQSGQ